MTNIHQDMETEELINAAKSVIVSIIEASSNERPSFITPRLNFSWTAFTEEISKRYNKKYNVSAFRMQLENHLQPLIADLTRRYRQKHSAWRMEKHEEYMRTHAEEIQKIRAKYREYSEAIIQRKHDASLNYHAEEIHNISEIKPNATLTKSMGNEQPKHHALPRNIIQKEEIEAVKKTLQDSLGDLYGSGKIPMFCYSTGRVNYDALSQTIGLPTNIVKNIAQNECRYLVLELKDIIASHHDWLEKWIANQRLGI